MNGLSEQLSAPGCPEESGIAINDSFQVPKLVLNAQVEVLCRGLNLRTEAIAHPDIGLLLGHQIKDHLGISPWNNLMVDR